PRDDAPDDVPGRLWLAGGDRDLVAHQGVGQRRLAGVGPPHEAGEACLPLRTVHAHAPICCFVSSWSGVATRSTSTAATRCRRPDIFSAVSDKPATSQCAPVIGTRPVTLPSSPPTVSTSSSSRSTSY